MSTLYVTEDWTFSPSTLTLSYIDTKKEAVLDPKTARLLGYFLRCHPKVCTRDEIYQELYGIENARADGTITAYVSKLRKLLETTPETKGKYLKTIPKTGYQFVGQYEIGSVSKKPINIQDSDISSANEIHENTASGSPSIQKVNSQTVMKKAAMPLEDLSSSHLYKRINWQRLYSVEFIIILLLMLLIAFLMGNEHKHEENNLVTPSVQLSATDWNLFHAESGINQSVALSSDGLFIAFVSGSKGANDLFVKGVLGEQLNKVFTAQSGVIESPAFSPNGTQLAFINRTPIDKTQQHDALQSTSQCNVVIVQLDSNHYAIENSERVVANCNPNHIKAPLAFIDENNLVFLEFNSGSQTSTLARIELDTGASSAILSGEQNDFGQVLAFAFNNGTSQLALISEMKQNESDLKFSICIYDLNEKRETHLVTTTTALSGIEWVNNQKLIVKKGQQLQLVDLENKDIRPVTLSQLKSELGETKKS